MTSDLKTKAQAFYDLPRAPGCFLVPNAWDAGSARLLAAAGGGGFPALGTTSAGIAFSRGLPDYEDRLPRAAMVRRTRANCERFGNFAPVSRLI